MMRTSVLGFTLVSALALAACGSTPPDPSTQIGPNPQLPAPAQYLLPPMKVAKTIPWDSATPTVPAGLKIAAFATGLQHPRTVYTLPNGDVLVVESSGPAEPVHRPKDLIMGGTNILHSVGVALFPNVPYSFVGARFSAPEAGAFVGL